MMNCIIIDDEPLALTQLAEYVGRIPFLTLEAACQDAAEALSVLAEKRIDLIFTDIDMPDLNGVDFVNAIVEPPMVIFTTAYSQYAIDGFRLNAIDYLLKPFSYQDCLRAAEKAQQLFLYKQSRKQPEENQPADGEDVLFVKSDYKVMRVEPERIKYIEGMSEYVRIHTDDRDKPIITLNSLQKLGSHLPSYFLRVHRSYIVNMRKVTEISRFRITFDKQTVIPVGDNYKERFLDYINRQGMI